MGSPSAVDECERTIRRAILEGGLRPGERLPAERTFAGQLGVNRTTLRSALTRLAQARLLTVRQGSGYVVQDYRKVAGLDLLPELAGLTSSRDELAELIGDLLEIRRRIAEMTLERIAARAGEVDPAPVAAAIDRFTEVVASGADVEEIAKADLEVGAALLEATGSRVLGLTVNPISIVVQQIEPLRDAIYRAPETNVAAYRLLLSFLEAPDASAISAVLAELARRDADTVAHVRG